MKQSLSIKKVVMQIDFRVHKIVKLEIRIEKGEELNLKKELYYGLLCSMFLNKSVLLVTVEPKKILSIGYVYGFFREVRIGNTTFLINNIKTCTSRILAEISKSEDFELGLLYIMLNNEDPGLDIDNILRHVHSKIGIENIPTLTVVCENDGDFF